MIFVLQILSTHKITISLNPPGIKHSNTSSSTVLSLQAVWGALPLYTPHSTLPLYTPSVHRSLGALHSAHCTLHTEYNTLYTVNAGLFTLTITRKKMHTIHYTKDYTLYYILQCTKHALHTATYTWPAERCYLKTLSFASLVPTVLLCWFLFEGHKTFVLAHFCHISWSYSCCWWIWGGRKKVVNRMVYWLCVLSLSSLGKDLPVLTCNYWLYRKETRDWCLEELDILCQMLRQNISILQINGYFHQKVRPSTEACFQHLQEIVVCFDFWGLKGKCLPH